MNIVLTDNKTYHIIFQGPEGKVHFVGHMVRFSSGTGYVVSTQFGARAIPISSIERISTRYNTKCPDCGEGTSMDCYYDLDWEEVHECLICHTLFRQKLVKMEQREVEDLKLKELLGDTLKEHVGHGLLKTA